MANSKSAQVKRKHKKRRDKISEERQLSISNAKKSTMRKLHREGQLPSRYLEKIS